jgi:hypothetical protein
MTHIASHEKLAGKVEDWKFFYPVTGEAPAWEMFKPGPIARRERDRDLALASAHRRRRLPKPIHLSR